MQTPLVSTRAQPEQQKENNPSSAVQPPQPTTENHLFPQLVFIPDDIYTDVTLQNINQLLQNHGFTVAKTIKFMSDYDTDQEILEHLKQQYWDDNTGLLILMEGWMVPLISFLTYLVELRRAVARETLITIALIGRPSATVFTAVSQHDHTIWQKKTATLGDPYLNLITLTPDKNISPNNDL